MKKTHLYISAFGLIASIIGTMFYSDNIFFLFTGTGIGVQLLRVAVLALVLAQLLTTPPRHAVLRTITGISASLLGAGTLMYFLLYSNVGIIDVMVFIHASIALGITALELTPAKNLVYKASRA